MHLTPFSIALAFRRRITEFIVAQKNDISQRLQFFEELEDTDNPLKKLKMLKAASKARKAAKREKQNAI